MAFRALEPAAPAADDDGRPRRFRAIEPPPTEKAKPKPNVGKDVAKSAATGVGKSVRNTLATVFSGSPQGMVSNALAAIGGSEGARRAAEVASPLGMLRSAETVLGLASGTTRKAVEKAPGRDYVPETRAGRYAEAIGEQAPNALIPGGMVRRGASMVLPGVLGEGAREGASALGLGKTGQTVAKLGGNVLGNIGAAARQAPLVSSSPRNPLHTIARRAKLDPAKAEAKALEMRSAGVEPNPLDVIGGRGQRIVRAIGVKSEVAGERLSDNARRISSSAKPAIMGRTKELGPHQGKTADELVSELFKARDDAAQVNFAPAYATQIRTNNDILRALSDEPGKAALRRARSAAVARMDDALVADIDRFLNADAPLDLSREARMARAREQGFNPDETLYHGTTQAVEGPLRPTPDGPGGPGVYTTTSPLQARNYANPNARPGPAPNIMPLIAREGAAAPVEQSAARVVQDPKDLRSTFDQFAPEGYRPAPEEVSAATLHRARIAMRERAQAAQQRNAGDLASGLNMRGAMLDDALERVPEMGPANADYRAKSQAIDVLGGGRKGVREDVFSTDPADYGRWLEGLSPEARAANQVAIRQEVLDTLGGQRSSTFGTVDELATSEYAQANLRQALGPEEADRYIANLRARLEQVRNARFADPNAGSRTAVLENDLGGVMSDAIDVGQKVARGDLWGLGQKTATYLLNRGVSERDAQAIADMMTDPAQTDRAIQLIAQRDPDAAQQVIAWQRAALLSAPAAANAQTALSSGQ